MEKGDLHLNYRDGSYLETLEKFSLAFLNVVLVSTDNDLVALLRSSWNLKVNIELVHHLLDAGSTLSDNHPVVLEGNIHALADRDQLDESESGEFAVLGASCHFDDILRGEELMKEYCSVNCDDNFAKEYCKL